VALSAVEDKAENMIIVIPGANGLAGQQEQEGLERVLGRTKVLLLHWKYLFSLNHFRIQQLIPLPTETHSTAR
jgi:hypothetical protein